MSLFALLQFWTSDPPIITSGQGQLCDPTCARGKHLLNKARMSAIRFSQGGRSKRKKAMLGWPENSDESLIPLHLCFLPSNPKILKTVPKTKETKRKVKVETSVSWDFAFCACPNFKSWYFASAVEGRQLLDLETTFRASLALYSPKLTRKQLD